MPVAVRRPDRGGTIARDTTWQAHPVLGALVRVGVLLVPGALAVGTAVLLARTLPAADGAVGRVLWWGAVLVGSTAVLAVTDRAARRLLPLAVLLELSLVFPDRAPSRLRAARTPSVRELEDRLAKLHGSGAGDEASHAAETLVTLVGILGLHDKRTRGHSERVRAFTDLLTEELGLPEEERQRARWAALVHDIGKLDVPGAVLNGTTALDDEAWALIRRHPEEGVRLAAGLLPWLGDWGRCVVEHHERFDGGGYPHGLAGEQISRAARIVSVCDSFEVMTSARSYNTVRTASGARRELIRCAGTQFDPEVVRVFVGISLGRLLWVLGPLTWLAQVPFVAAGDRAGQLVKAGALTAAVGGLVAAGALPGPASGTPERPRAVAVAAGPAVGAPVLPAPSAAAPRLRRPPARRGAPGARTGPARAPGRATARRRAGVPARAARRPSGAAVCSRPRDRAAGPTGAPCDRPGADCQPAALHQPRAEHHPRADRCTVAERDPRADRRPRADRGPGADACARPDRSPGADRPARAACCPGADRRARADRRAQRVAQPARARPAADLRSATPRHRHGLAVPVRDRADLRAADGRPAGAAGARTGRPVRGVLLLGRDRHHGVRHRDRRPARAAPG